MQIVERIHAYQEIIHVLQEIKLVQHQHVVVKLGVGVVGVLQLVLPHHLGSVIQEQFINK
jgi:hypothetical protein